MNEAHSSGPGAAANDSAAMALWFECYQFLVYEAALLDDNRMEEWLGLLSEDISYEVPLRQTRRRTEDPYPPDAWHMKEDISSMKMRIARLATKSAWGEDPPSRTRRLIGNLRAVASDSTTISVTSNILVYYGRGDGPEHTLLAAERRDVLRRSSDGLRLHRREVILSHATLPVQSLGIFL